ncbi:MAG: non-canonical purine NTP pyrophosphatase, partial [Gammaproteobacteria bacterium]|nr:non-canonical purine NTP pyrophosphatase [Gammaproteobacteria bacterium]
MRFAATNWTACSTSPPTGSRACTPPRTVPGAADPPLVVATGNPGKLREFRALLDGLPFRLLSQAELGVEPPEETGATFLENALLKARHAQRCTGGLAVLADDSGLEVDALGGAPGVHSARYAGAAASDAENNAKLIAALAGVAEGRRTANYRCVLVHLPAEDPRSCDAARPGAPVIEEASWAGLIVDRPRGRGGFGYDPHFLLPELG